MAPIENIVSSPKVCLEAALGSEGGLLSIGMWSHLLLLLPDLVCEPNSDALCILILHSSRYLPAVVIVRSSDTLGHTRIFWNVCYIESEDLLLAPVR